MSLTNLKTLNNTEMTGLEVQTVLVFKTNIQNEYQKSYVQIIMNSAYGIHDCTVDLNDVDKVLRVEIEEKDTENKDIDENYVIEKMNSLGFMCKTLED